MDETDLIEVALDVTPNKYQAVLTSKKGNDLTLLDLEIIMYQHWRQ
jgi:hypothetical protein